MAISTLAECFRRPLEVAGAKSSRTNVNSKKEVNGNFSILGDFCVAEQFGVLNSWFSYKAAHSKTFISNTGTDNATIDYVIMSAVTTA